MRSYGLRLASLLATAAIGSGWLMCAGAADALDGRSPIHSLQDLDAASEAIRHSVWENYEISSAEGPDVRGRLRKDDLREWVMDRATTDRLASLRAAIQAGRPGALTEADTLIQDQHRRLNVINGYWGYEPLLRLQRGLWMKWVNLLPNDETREGLARVQALEREVIINGLTPGLDPLALQPQLTRLLEAYNDERLKLADAANEVLKQRHADLGMLDRDIPCTDHPPFVVHDTHAHPAKVTYIPPLASFYPKDARRALSSGLVVLKVSIDDAGCMQRAEILRSSGDPLLDRAALQFSEHMDFQPPINDGVGIATALSLPIRFDLHAAGATNSPGGG